MTPEAVALAGIAAMTLLLGMSSPPRHLDALTYHVPRILHWMQNGSLDPYPTHIDRQIWIGAGAEYFLLHLRLLAGTDRVLTLVQWLSFLGLAPVVSLIARELNASKRGEAFAILFALTLPMAITQSTGAQVDLFASFCLCVAVALLLRVRRNGIGATALSDAVALGSAMGLAVLAKAVNALYLAPFIAWTLAALSHSRRGAKRLTLLVALASASAVAINGGQVYRNIRVWNNPLGNSGQYELANAVISPASIASNVVRNVTLHANTGFREVNGALYRAVVAVHDVLGIDHDDRRTTYGNSHFDVPRKGEDEGLSGNRWHLLLIVVAAVLAWRTRPGPTALFLGCVITGALIFAAYLKWQPWNSRLHLPLFVVAAGGVAAALERSVSERTLKLTGWFLIAFAMLPVFRNISMPIVTREPYFLIPYRDRVYPTGRQGSDVLPEALDFIAARGCARVGLAWNNSASEYSVWKLLEWRTRGPIEIRHVGVSNATQAVASENDRAFMPCAVLAASDPRRPASAVIPPGYRKALAKGSVAVWLPSDSSGE